MENKLNSSVMSNKTINSNSSNYEATTNSLNAFLKNPSILTEEGIIQKIEQIYKEILIEDENRFQLRAQRTTIATKKKILQLLALNFSTIDKETIEILKPKLLILTASFKQLMKESILNFAVELDEISRKTKNANTKEIIGKIKTIFGPLLRTFFVYKEYLRHKKDQAMSGISILIGSGTKIDSSKKLQAQAQSIILVRKRFNSYIKVINERDIEQIEEKFEQLTIKQLMNKYLENQFQDINGIEEICRICSQKVKIEELKRHVSYCKKKSQIRQRDMTISGEIKRIMDALKLKQIQIQFSDRVKTEAETELVDILKAIFKSIPRGPGARRSSIFSTPKNISTQTAQKINAYLLDQENKDLEEFLRLHQQKLEIDEKLQNLQKNYQNQKDRVQSNQNSLKSFGQLKKFCDSKFSDSKSIPKSLAKSNAKSRFAKRSSEESDQIPKIFGQNPDQIKNSQKNNSIISSISSLQSIKEDNEIAIQKVHLSQKKLRDVRGSIISRRSRNSRIDVGSSKISRKSLHQRSESNDLKIQRKARQSINARKRSGFIPGNMRISSLSRARLKRAPTMIKQDSDSSLNSQIGTRKALSCQAQITRSFKAQSNMSTSISIKSFQILLFLGKGAFGRVYLARRIQTKDIYAIKVINIKPNWGQQQLQAIKNQHNIFKKIGGDHLVKAPFSFRQGMAHFFIMEFMPGGDLGKMLGQEVYLQQNIAKFYIVEIILAIEHLHKAGIIHRDLKPQNLCIDAEGHLKLTDFGLSEIRIQDKLTHAKQVLGKTKLSYQHPRGMSYALKDRTAIRVTRKSQIKLIGTPDYIAPQIINRTSINNQTIDWWSLGVMIYEILIGVRPFCGQTVEEVIDNILRFNIQWPEIGDQDGMITENAKDLIEKLTNRDFNKRLGVNGAQEILNHPFFEGIDWQNIKSLTPPIGPRIKIDLLQLEDLQQDASLRQEIINAINQGNNQNKSQTEEDSLKLTNFVRYDLLGAETIQIAEKNIVSKGCKLKRLASFAKNTDFDSQNDITQKMGKRKSLPKKSMYCNLSTDKENASQNENL